MGGLGHDFKAGINYIHEPRLYVTFDSGSADYAYTHLDLSTNGLDQRGHAEQARRRRRTCRWTSLACTSRTTGA